MLVAALIGGAALYVAYGRLHETYKGYAEAETFVDIPPGAGPRRSASGWSTLGSCAMR